MHLNVHLRTYRLLLFCAHLKRYGCSEQFLWSWIQSRNVAPSAVVVGSKWGYRYTADWKVLTDGGTPHEVKDHSVEHLTVQAAETAANLVRLRCLWLPLLGRIDLLKLLSAEFGCPG